VLQFDAERNSHQLAQEEYVAVYNGFQASQKIKNGKGISSNEINHMANKAILNKFSSVNLHMGLNPSPKDDLESLGYILIYFFKEGNLFEKNSKISTKDDKIKYYEQQKLTMIPETMCASLPSEMTSYMNYIKALQTNQLNDKVEYEHLKKLFKNLFNKHCETEEFQYDWLKKAKTYNSDTVSKTTDRTTLDISLSRAELEGPTALSPENTRDSSRDNPNQLDPESKGRMANFPFKKPSYFQSQYQKKGTGESAFSGASGFSDGSMTNNSPYNHDQSNPADTSNQNMKEIKFSASDNDSNEEDFDDPWDPNDSVQLKFEKLMSFQDKVKTIESIKTLSRVTSSILPLTKKLAVEFQLKKSMT